MSGETDRSPSPWTVDSLKEHLETLIALQASHYDRVLTERDRRYDGRFNSQEKAVLKSEAASEDRFNSVNEFRQTLTDQATTFITRSETEIRISAATDRINTLESRLDRIEGRTTGIGVSTSALFGGLAALGTIVGLIVVITNLLT